MIDKLTLPPVIGFETKYRHCHTESSQRWIFNAHRILSYIPIISYLGAIIKFFIDAFQTEKKLNENRKKIDENDTEIKSITNTSKERQAQFNQALPTVDSNIDTIIKMTENNKNEPKEGVDQNLNQRICLLDKKIEQTTYSMNFIHQTITLFGQLLITREDEKKDFEKIKSLTDNNKMIIEDSKQLSSRLKQKYATPSAFLLRFAITCLGLGILYLPADLYHTAWRHPKVTPLITTS